MIRLSFATIQGGVSKTYLVLLHQTPNFPLQQQKIHFIRHEATRHRVWWWRNRGTGKTQPAIIESHVGVSKNRGGPPKSSILIGFFILNHPFSGEKPPIFWVDTHVISYNTTDPNRNKPNVRFLGRGPRLKAQTLASSHVPWSKVAILGMAIPPFIGILIIGI